MLNKIIVLIWLHTCAFIIDISWWFINSQYDVTDSCSGLSWISENKVKSNSKEYYGSSIIKFVIEVEDVNKNR